MLKDMSTFCDFLDIAILVCPLFWISWTYKKSYVPVLALLGTYQMAYVLVFGVLGTYVTYVHVLHFFGHRSDAMSTFCDFLDIDPINCSSFCHFSPCPSYPLPFL